MRSVVVALSSLFALSLTLPALADPFLIDPTGGTLLAFTDNDNGVRPVARPLGISFTYFNEAITGVHPAVNGSLAWTGAQGSTTGNGNADTGGLPVGSVRRIAPLWDDLLLLDTANGGTDTIRERRDNSTFYSVTWSVHKAGQTTAVPASMEFQTVLFGATTTVRGFNFQPDDIAFSYRTISTPQGGAATIGLQEGTGSNRVAVPPATLGGDSTGRFTSLSALPIHNTTDQFVLFRRQSDGSYAVTLQSLVAVPEPGTIALLALTALPGIALLRRRR
jgi:hypothetical protein